MRDSRPISWHSLAAYRAGIADSLLFRPITYSNHSNNRAGIAPCAIPALCYYFLPLPYITISYLSPKIPSSFFIG